MHDLILVNSPIHDYSRYPRYASSYSTPVGLLYLATVAREAGFRVKILDAEAEQLPPLEIAREINSAKPAAAGFNAFSINFSIVEQIIDAIAPSIKVIVGGPHVSNMLPAHFAKRLSRAEILVRHDGEGKILEILKGVDPSAIPGIYFRDASGNIVANKEGVALDLDSLPIPDRTILATEPYVRDGLRWMDISISRGCIFSCKFCAGSCKSNGTTYRRRSTQSARTELRHLQAHHGVEGVQIVDDLPFNGRAELEEFLAMLDRERIRLTWEINFPLQFLRTLSSEHFIRMRKAGIARLSFGIESGSYRLRRAMGKLVKDDKLFEIIEALTGNGISAKGYFIIGFPGESRTEMAMTIDLAKRLFEVGRVGEKSFFRPRVFMFKPMPGSALWAQLLAEGYSEEEMLDYADFHVDNDYFKKHAWGAAVTYSLLDPHEIQEIINAFYNDIGESTV
jgi:anaerobic magnesium-protoporphyrin IX monomethyl ester cyclase